MIKKVPVYDLIVIGGGPAGIISATCFKNFSKNSKVLLIKSVEKGVVPCGIPYMFKTLKNPKDNLVGDSLLMNNKIDLLID